ncbi:hypothetical protein [Pseudarthrobacter sp. NPDC080039]|uniref:hypothetical protein n=1 Tax=unclassified Pseudarthrobacter TaxID=2647000 RepID=UPI00344D5B2B
MTNFPMIPVHVPVHLIVPVLFQDWDGKLSPRIWNAAKPLMWKSPAAVTVSNTGRKTVCPWRLVNARLHTVPLGMLSPFLEDTAGLAIVTVDPQTLLLSGVSHPKPPGMTARTGCRSRRWCFRAESATGWFR